MDRRKFLTASIAAAVAANLPASRLFAAARAVPIAGDLAAVTGDGALITLEKAALQELRDSLRGPLLLAGEPGYDTARRVLNESIDRHPALVIQPSGVTDIRHAVAFAHDRKLLVAVKCGGHSFSGKSTCDRGMQIDLSGFRGVRADPVARVAYVAGGSLLGEIDHETMAFGLATTTGTVSHTGVGGLTLGGGFGRLARRHGLAVDNLKSVDIVTADGRFLHASADENPDLYWGVRGGGGNFGVVTMFEFALHPTQRKVVGGDIVFPISRSRELLEFYRDYSASAPEDLYVDATMAAPPGGRSGVFLFSTCYSGDPADAERVLAPIRKLGTPLTDTIKTRDYVDVQRMHDNTDPRNAGQYLKTGFLGDFPDKLIDAAITGFQAHPERSTATFFQHGGGAIGRVPADATAFPHRYAQYNMLNAITWPLSADRKPHTDYQRAYWATLEPFTSGYYTNETADEEQSVVDENYQGNIGRMRAVKRQYDPGNLFRLNANVAPA